MIQNWFNEVVMPLVYAGIAGIALGVLKGTIKDLGELTANFLKNKAEEAKAAAKAATATEKNQNFIYIMNEGLKAWNEIEEHFRINEFIGNKTEEKKKMFEELILKKIPYLTSEDINSIRDSIAGEYNKSKNIVLAASKDIQEELKEKGLNINN